MRKIFFIVLIFCIFVILSIATLEILAKKYQCPIVRPPLPNCWSVGLRVVLPETDRELLQIKIKRETGEKISKEEYYQLAEKFIREVGPEVLYGFYNGISCGNVGYVRSDLPKEAKKFVKRHELEHLLQTGQEKNPEFSANRAAAKEYSLGLIQTIFFTVKNRAKYSDSSICYIISLWKTFKIYMLP